ncbi:rRNA maturation RNase YbeY [Flavobacterium okayamense]|uniref:Endoribonuclease YbeY n=1 Tax=Flavobacterium okayamense TaxID=2830782 RepID=A0ABN6HTC3_9FLAO|nr:rRNA maturation RNase YbeY [Flavobacterium okayamense]BCY27799.1 endoribonuclease YbeY [Flavobacterium okayamense]
MITYNYESDFQLENEEIFSTWIEHVVLSEDKILGEVNYIFCDDEYLYKINVEYLDHDTLTDIISFDYSEGNLVQGDIFISIERVVDNASDFDVPFVEELKRVMIHGILHYCGYKDKSDSDEKLMRSKEDEKIKMFHVKH